MRTAAAHLRKGVKATMLEYILEEAKRRGYKSRREPRSRASGPGFDAAHALYEKYGFRYCGPFANYIERPFQPFHDHGPA